MDSKNLAAKISTCAVEINKLPYTGEFARDSLKVVGDVFTPSPEFCLGLLSRDEGTAAPDAPLVRGKRAAGIEPQMSI